MAAPQSRAIPDLVAVFTILFVGVIAMFVFHSARTGGEFSRLVYSDEGNYYLPAAEGIRQDGFAWFLTERSLWTGPLNPLWVSAFAGNIALIKVANIVLYFLAGLAVWDTAKRLFTNRAGIIAVAAYATFIPLFKHTPTLLTEPLFVPLIVFALWLVVLGERYKRYETWILLTVGFLLGLATLTRPTLQLFPVFLLTVWALAKLVSLIRKIGSFQVDFKRIGLVLVGISLIVVPFGVKNLVSLDKLGLANGSGAVLYLGNDLRTHGGEPGESGLQFNTDEITTPYTHLDTEGDRRLLVAAFERIQRDPIDVALLQPSKALKLVFGSPGYYFGPQENAIEFFKERSWVDRLNLWDLALTSLLAVVGITGLIALRTSPFVKLVFGSLVAYLILINTLLFPIPRMLLAAFPVLMVFTGGAFVKLPKKLAFGAVGSAVAVVMFIAFKGLFGTTGIVSERYVGYFDPIATISTDQWEASNDVAQLPGSITSTGPDPYIVFGTRGFEATKNQMIFITVRAPEGSDSGNGGYAQVFWRGDTEGFTEESSQVFELQRDGEFHIYAISPSLRGSWSGLVSEIRIDFPDHRPNKTYGLDGIEIRK